MLLTRVIPVLLLDNDALVKTEKYKKPSYLGDPLNAVTIFNEKEVDEIVVLDITATTQSREPNFELIADIASQAFMPFAYGGGITTLEQIRKLFNLGVEKVILNSINYTSLNLITEAAKIYGSQSIVGVIDVKKNIFGKADVYSHSATKAHKIDPIDWAKKLQAAGAGELIINSVDRESSYKGYDLELLKKITDVVDIPVVANGGAGNIEHFGEAKKQSNVSAVAAGSMFVFHGKHKAVLITYPSIDKLERIFGE